MNRLITVVTKSIGSIRKAIVNYMSQPKEVHAAVSTVIVDRTDEEEIEPVTSKDSVHFSDSDKGPINIQVQTHLDGVKLFREFVAARNHSINRKLFYNKKKTQRRNWSKWKRRKR
ncbi:hypothetical protein LKM01_17920 [Bacillus pacificus]|uniref:hypothetical protein n=1 Tax=Bacillus pacificus TaxID=2026187 RepID=UPI001E40101C|nr:hypothetical protein [Bacillus pacificus]MCC2483704.1 hypothetical protein [Bacillus pacificus]